MSAALPRNTVLLGDAHERLATLPAESIDCVITSPPYFRLRNYNTPGQIGLEEHIDQWVERLRQVLGEVHRVLKPTGALWLNLGDTYARQQREGAGPKSLVLAPERVAAVLMKDGWLIRNKVVWAKTNPMPTSMRDRLSCTYEVMYFAVKARRYFFDLDAIRLPHRSRPTPTRSIKRAWAVPPEWRGPAAGSNTGLDRLKAAGSPGHPLGKNPGDVWTMATAAYRGAHFATFPAELVRRPLRATCPRRLCASCGQPWERAAAPALGHLAVAGELRPGCACRADWRRGIVLDPFMGSGTTAVVAEQEGRDWLGIELSPELAVLAMKRIASVQDNRSDNTGLERAA